MMSIVLMLSFFSGVVKGIIIHYFQKLIVITGKVYKKAVMIVHFQSPAPAQFFDLFFHSKLMIFSRFPLNVLISNVLHGQ